MDSVLPINKIMRNGLEEEFYSVVLLSAFAAARPLGSIIDDIF